MNLNSTSNLATAEPGSTGDAMDDFLMRARRKTNRFSGGGIMVWGGITYQERTELRTIVGNLNATRYRDEILAPVVLPFIRRHRFNHVCQDNARCHVAHIEMTF